MTIAPVPGTQVNSSICDFLRISIGSEAEMQALIEALGEIGAR
ncbi:hypothetical protein [Kushneria phosphatilytica]|nr:hypothetical protein [Kushneria phosphatilytica]